MPHSLGIRPEVSPCLTLLAVGSWANYVALWASFLDLFSGSTNPNFAFTGMLGGSREMMM